MIVDGPDPGLDPGGAETEADLDVEWAGAVAPNATIDLVVSESTEASLGADLSAQYAVDNNLAPILNESFGLCEFSIGTSGNTFYNQPGNRRARRHGHGHLGALDPQLAIGPRSLRRLAWP